MWVQEIVTRTLENSERKSQYKSLIVEKLEQDSEFLESGLHGENFEI